jgi:hypothetical protein
VPFDLEARRRSKHYCVLVLTEVLEQFDVASNIFVGACVGQDFEQLLDHLFSCQFAGLRVEM